MSYKSDSQHIFTRKELNYVKKNANGVAQHGVDPHVCLDKKTRGRYMVESFNVSYFGKFQ